MRWDYTRFVVLFVAAAFFSGPVRADDVATIANITEQLRSPSIGQEPRIKLLFARGLGYDRLGRLDEAIADYGAILEIAPNNYAALNNRANAYRRQGALRDAKRDYLASLVAGNPRPAYSEYGLGQIAEAEGDRSAAREHYRRALASDPGFALASQRLAVLGPGQAFSAIDLQPPQIASGSMPDSDRIVLKRPTPQRVVLKKPQTPKTERRGWTRVAEAKGGKTSDVMLRPAIDASTPPTRPRRASGNQKVQLGAWRTRGEADAGLKAAARQAGEVLQGMGLEIVEANIPGKGRYFRLRAGPTSRSEALKLCTRLKVKGVDCILAPL